MRMIAKSLQYNKISTVIMIFGVFTILIFLSYWTTGYLLTKSKITYCDTDACNETAKFIIENMDNDIDPCDNLYRFACGSFINKSILRDDEMTVDTFSRLQNLIQDQLKSSIIKNVTLDNEPTIFKKLREYYNVCIENEEEYDPADEYFYLDEITYLEILNDFGGWPVLVEDSWNETDFSWDKTIANLREFGLADDFFIYYAVAIDKENNSIKRINLTPASFGISEIYLSQGFSQENVKAYYKYMIDVAVFFKANRSQAEVELKESLIFEMKLANIALNATDQNDFLKPYEPVTIKELQSLYPYMNWFDYLNKTFYPQVALNETEEIILMAPAYFEQLGTLLTATPKRVLANYIFWRTTKLVLHYLSRRTRDIEHAYRASYEGNRTISPRWEICFNQVLTYFPIAMGSLYVRTHVNDSTKESVQAMLANIHATFVDAIEEIHWMDDDTKAAALNKLQSMSSAVAYPEELLNNTKINEYYEKLEIDERSYFKTVLYVNKFYVERNLRSLRKSVQKNSWTGIFGAAATINAFYNLQTNIITIPSGIMQDFYYQIERPKYINYATLGSVIGHEMTHGFDNVGRLFDENGNKYNWWNNKTQKKFLNKTKCFVEQYGMYRIQEVGMNVNGNNTLGENIADNGGLKEAYRAYIKWQKKIGTEEPRLRGLERYTPRQLFWIAYANIWCEKSRLELLNSTVQFDSHAPNEFRVIGPVSNMPEFAEDFGCTANSIMNPDKRCSVW